MTLMEATAAQHFNLPKGEPAKFVRNGKLETCRCRDCLTITPPVVANHGETDADRT